MIRRLVLPLVIVASVLAGACVVQGVYAAGIAMEKPR
jgi:hypothetical protein